MVMSEEIDIKEVVVALSIAYLIKKNGRMHSRWG